MLAVVAAIPLVRFLVHPGVIAAEAQDRVQSRLRGRRLPTAVGCFDPIRINDCDRVSVQTYISASQVSIGEVDVLHFGVVAFEIFTFLNRGDHPPLDHSHFQKLLVIVDWSQVSNQRRVAHYW